MVSDFFFPSLGGIETHIYYLSQCLMQRGFKVIVITHYYGDKYQGVRYLSNGLKVYYLPFFPFVLNTTFPTFFSFLPLIRNILFRERADIVHGHQTTSNLAHETLRIARALGLQVVFTDHSLFGFSDMACIHLNKMILYHMHDVDACICVSHTHKENFVLRSGMHPSRVYVINNAVDSGTLFPDPSRRPKPPEIRIVVLSRLTYRKGIDLLVTVIPPICNKLPHINFVIGGDGPKRIILEEMREKFRLHDRVELLGAVSRGDVCSLLQSGHIFLNTSLTESFCIAIVEAAACGMLVVSTNVGGVPEVLPPHMVLLADPEDAQVTRRLEEAVAKVHTIDPFLFHEQVRRIYSWHDVAARTERVYFSVLLPDQKAYLPCKAFSENGTGSSCTAWARQCACCQRRLLTGSNCESREKAGPRLREPTSPCLRDESPHFSERVKSPSQYGKLPRGRECGERTEVLRRHQETESRELRDCGQATPTPGACTCTQNSCHRCDDHTEEGPAGSLPAGSEEKSGRALKDPSFDNLNNAESDGDLSLRDSLCRCCERPPLCCGCVILPSSPPPLPSAFVIVQRLRKLYRTGPVSGKIFCILAIMTWAYVRILEFLFP
ncbi:n-acetylglucosaminyl-phosphatidylinositol biosynthetic protein family gt4 protein, partial [Cystoisospora suis]